MWHLYEVVISNSLVWLKVQASSGSSEQSAAFFQSRFNGTDYIVDGQLPVTPFKLSSRSHYIANWASIEERLPPGWDDDEFHIAKTPYPWCETLSEDCDCLGAKGRLDEAFCSDLGSHDESEKLAHKSRERKAPLLHSEDGGDYSAARRIPKTGEASRRGTFSAPGRGPRWAEAGRRGRRSKGSSQPTG